MVSGWVHDLCQSLGYSVLVANPNGATVYTQV